MNMSMDDLETPPKWSGNTFDALDLIDDSFDLIKAKALIKKMRSACEEALKLPKLAITANDPVFGTSETRKRKTEIENKLHRVIAEAAEFNK